MRSGVFIGITYPAHRQAQDQNEKVAQQSSCNSGKPAMLNPFGHPVKFTKDFHSSGNDEWEQRSALRLINRYRLVV